MVSLVFEDGGGFGIIGRMGRKRALIVVKKVGEETEVAVARQAERIESK